uniref:Uncharacterized protein n=1 Tax=Parascaris equorum TaxID=6256 RepID=A0A914RVT0_PAREQ
MRSASLVDVKTFKLDTFRIFEGVDINQVNKLEILPSDEDPKERTPRPQRFQDAFRSIITTPKPQTFQRIRPAKPFQPRPIEQSRFVQQPRLIPQPQQIQRVFMQTRPMQQQFQQSNQQSRQHITHVIAVTNVATVPPVAMNALPQPPRAVVPVFATIAPQPQVGFQTGFQQPIQRSIAPVAQQSGRMNTIWESTVDERAAFVECRSERALWTSLSRKTKTKKLHPGAKQAYMIERHRITAILDPTKQRHKALNTD